MSTSAQCFTCKHWLQGVPSGDEDVWFCAAFPGRIPEEISSGEVSHKKPYPGDHGIQWEPFQPGVTMLDEVNLYPPDAPEEEIQRAEESGYAVRVLSESQYLHLTR